MKLKHGNLIVLATIAIIVSGCFHKKTYDVLTPVEWTEVREEIAKHVCVMVDELPDGSKSYSFNTGEMDGCTREEETTHLTSAIDAVLEQANPLLIGIDTEQFGFKFDASLPIDISNKKLQEACLSAEMFLNPILRRLYSALAAEGLICEDCPIPSHKSPRNVTWEEFVPYLTAYAWPDPVHTPRDEVGNPTGKSEYSFHICSGINGISEMESPDMELSRVAYIIAIGSKKFIELAYENFKSVLNEGDFQQLTDEEQTDYLRRHMSQKLEQEKALLPEVCRVLHKYENDLRVRLDRCQY